jgi:PAS domain S-box-containing protein
LDHSALLVDLLPIGTVLTRRRVIVSSNPSFAELFGYTSAEIVGKSLEMLYPSRRHFVERGEEWLDHFRVVGGHRDVRMMVRKGDRPIRVRVSGRCQDRGNPYEIVACTFEPVASSDLNFELSARERDIVSEMGEGRTSKQIARRLNLSHRTVETYRSRLMVKTGAHNAAQLLQIVRGVS